MVNLWVASGIWTVHLCVWIKLVMVQKVGLLRLYGYAFELSSWSKFFLDFLEWGVEHKIL